MLFVDKIFRVPRIWSNRELKKFSHLFTGDIVNVSAWKDEDKEGLFYKDYFSKAKSYTITNFKSDMRGFQGQDGEIFLDLEKTLPDNMKEKYSVVFNHTTLEHVYNVKQAFNNLCDLSSDIVILVVPFLQQMHTDYGDYWRFTPLAVKRMFEENKMELIYCSFNEHARSSVYLFCIGSKHPNRWDGVKKPFSYRTKTNSLFVGRSSQYVGCRSIANNVFYRVFTKVKKKFKIS